MKVNFSKPFVDALGNPIIEGAGTPQMISERLCIALFNVSAIGGKPITGEQKYQAYKIMCAVRQNASEVELSAEDASFVKLIAAEVLSAGAYGQVYDTIENAESK